MIQNKNSKIVQGSRSSAASKGSIVKALRSAKSQQEPLETSPVSVSVRDTPTQKVESTSAFCYVSHIFIFHPDLKRNIFPVSKTKFILFA